MMIQKIRDLVRIQELINDISVRIREQEKIVRSHSKDMDDFHKEMRRSMREILAENLRIREQITSDITHFRKLQARLGDELSNFKLFKNESRKIFMDRMETEFSIIKKKLNSEISGINDLRCAINSRSDDLYALSDEIKRLRKITSKIRSQDFELVRHKKNIEKYEKEKQEMAKQIDSLQRLVARMRRR